MPRGPRGVNARHVPLARRREMATALPQGLETEMVSAYLMSQWFASCPVENPQILRVDCLKPARC